MGATWLATVGANLYWYDKGTRKIRTIPAAGGTAADVYTNTAPGNAAAPSEIAGFLVAPDASSIYISQGTTVLQQAPLVGGTPKIVDQSRRKTALRPRSASSTATSNIVFPATYNGDVDAPKLGGATPAVCGLDDPANPGNAIMTTCPRLARSQGELFPDFVAVIAGRAYWADGSNVKSEMIGSVGTTFDAVSTTINGTITAAFATPDVIYFAEDGFVEKAPAAVNTSSAPPILIARGQKSPSSIFVDATRAYWATGDCAIMSQLR